MASIDSLYFHQRSKVVPWLRKGGTPGEWYGGQINSRIWWENSDTKQQEAGAGRGRREEALQPQVLETWLQVSLQFLSYMKEMFPASDMKPGFRSATGRYIFEVIRARPRQVLRFAWAVLLTYRPPTVYVTLWDCKEGLPGALLAGRQQHSKNSLKPQALGWYLQQRAVQEHTEPLKGNFYSEHFFSALKHPLTHQVSQPDCKMFEGGTLSDSSLHCQE